MKISTMVCASLVAIFCSSDAVESGKELSLVHRPNISKFLPRDSFVRKKSEENPCLKDVHIPSTENVTVLLCDRIEAELADQEKVPAPTTPADTMLWMLTAQVRALTIGADVYNLLKANHRKGLLEDEIKKVGAALVQIEQNKCPK